MAEIFSTVSDDHWSYGIPDDCADAATNCPRRHNVTAGVESESHNAESCSAPMPTIGR